MSGTSTTPGILGPYTIHKALSPPTAGQASNEPASLPDPELQRLVDALTIIEKSFWDSDKEYHELSEKYQEARNAWRDNNTNLSKARDELVEYVRNMKDRSIVIRGKDGKVVFGGSHLANYPPSGVKLILTAPDN